MSPFGMSVSSSPAAIRRARVAGAVLFAALLFVAALPARAVEVRGTLVGGTVTLQRSPRDSYWEVWNGFVSPDEARFDYVRSTSVVLTGTGPSVVGPQVDVKLQGGAPLPSTIVVPPGTVLRFQNDDDFTHELYAEGADWFSAEATSAGATRGVRSPNTAGHFVLRDRLVPHAVAHLHVVPNVLAVARVDRAGRYSFGVVGAGSYTLKVFTNDKEAKTQEVVVGATGAALVVEPISLREGN